MQLNIIYLNLQVMDNQHRLLSSLRPFLAFSRILGMRPINIKITEAKIAQISKFGILHSILIISLLSLFHIFVPLRLKGDEFTIIVQDFGVQLYNLIFTIVCSSFIIRCKTLIVIVNNIFKYSVLINDESFHKRIYWLLISEIIIYQIIILAGCLSDLFSQDEYDITLKEVAVLVILIYLEKNIFYIVNLWIGNCLLYTCKIFKELNNRLEKMESSDLFLNRKRISRWNGTEFDFATFLSVYNNMCDHCLLMNRCFGMPMMCFSIIVMAHFITYFYHLIVFQNDFFVSAPWMIQAAVQEYIVLFSFEEVTKEVRKNV